MNRKIKFTLPVKAFLSVLFTEFLIMVIISSFAVLRDAPAIYIALLDTALLGVAVIIVIKFTFRPLKNMIDKMERIKQGEKGIRLDIRSQDEIGVISMQINRMLDGLEYSYRQIEESEKLLATITDGIDEEIMLIDKDFRIIWANKKVKELTHWETKDIIGKYCYKITHHLEEPCKEPLDVCPLKEMTGKKAYALHTHFDKEGEPIYVEVIAHPLMDEKGETNRFIHISRDVTERMKMIRELKQARDKLEEYSRKLEEMVEERTVKLTKNLIELANMNDELKKTQAQLIQAGKMAAIGQMATGIAHEINNPLTVIMNNIELLKMCIQRNKNLDQQDLNQAVKMMEESVLRCNLITRDLLGFSHVSKERFEPVNINEVIKKTVALVEYELQLENIAIKMKLQPDLPVLLGDFQLLQQLFLNMLINASWAIKEHKTRKGIVAITTHYKTGGPDLYIDISDTGIGIPQKHLHRIFEAFFTTKDVGKGTGLGLSIVYSIIKQHKGDISVESYEGKGATFKITFPVLKKDAHPG